MNRVNCQTSRTQILDHLAKDGYVLFEDVLSPDQTAELSTAFAEQVALHPPTPGAVRVEVPRIIERDLRFEQLMDPPAIMDIVTGALGPDIELATSGELDQKLPHTKAYVGWHNDFTWMPSIPYPRQIFWLRCTYFLSDVTDDSGPFTLLPGSHLMDHQCPSDVDQQNPRHIHGQIGMTGRAGCCLINNTEIWHTNSPNNSDESRRLIMICYKHGWMKQWQQGYDTTPEFANRQTDPLRRQLCGLYPWHSGAAIYPASTRDPVVIK